MLLNPFIREGLKAEGGQDVRESSTEALVSVLGPCAGEKGRSLKDGEPGQWSDEDEAQMKSAT